MNKRHYEHTLPNIRGSLSNTYHSITIVGNDFPYFSSAIPVFPAYEHKKSGSTHTLVSNKATVLYFNLYL